MYGETDKYSRNKNSFALLEKFNIVGIENLALFFHL